MKKFAKALVLLCSLAATSKSICGAARVTQSLVVEFPANGKVVVQTREEAGRNPRIVLIAKEANKVLLNHSISAADDVLKPDWELGSPSNPFLRFRVVRADCFAGPLILAIAVAPGGSDSGFWAIVIGEVGGKLALLTPQTIFTHVQGGFYLGRVNNQLGCGLLAWSFIWDEGSHYDFHPYKVEIYSLQGERFVRQRRYISKRKYEGNGAAALRELGIYVRDLRAGMLKVKNYVE